MPLSIQYQSTGELLRQVLRTLLTTVHADLGGFFVFDEQREQVVIGTIEGQQPPGSLPPVQVVAVPPLSVPAERWLLEHRRPLHLHRPRDWRLFPPMNPGLRALAEQHHLVGLAVPLEWEGDFVGVAYVWRHRTPRPYTRREIREAQRWCRLASAVAVTSRLWIREAQLRADLESLIELDRRLGAATSLALFGRSVRETLTALLPTASVFLTLRLDSESIVVYPDDRPLHLEQALRSSLSQFAALGPSGQAFFLLSRGDAPPFLDPVVAALPESVTHLLVLPIEAEDETLGVVVAWGDSRLASLGSQKGPVLSILQRQLSAIATRLCTQLQLQRTVEQLRAVLTVAQGVPTTDSVVELLERVEQVLRPRIRYDAMVYLEPDPESPSMLRVAWGSGTYPEAHIGSRIPVEGSLAGFAYRTGTHIAVPDTWEDPRAYHRPGRRFPLRSLVIHPVRVSGETVAVLGFGRVAVHPFSDYDRELTGLIAHELGTALVVVRQRQALKSYAENQAFLAEISWIVLKDNDPRSFAQSTIERIARWAECDASFICLCPLEPDQVVVAASSDADALGGQLPSLAKPDLLRWLAGQTTTQPILFETSAVVPASLRAPIEELLRRYGILMVVPLAPDERPVGALLLGWRDRSRAPRHASDGTVRQLQALLMDALARWIAERERTVLTRLTFELAESRSVEMLASSFLEAARAFVPYDSAAFFGFERESRQLVPLATTPHFHSLPAGWTLPIEAFFPTGEIEDAEPKVIDHPHDAQFADALRQAAAGGPVTLLVSPVVADREVLGLVVLGRFGRSGFHTAERRRCAGLATSAAVALRLVSARERERALYRASVEAMAAAVDAKDPATHNHSRRVAEIARMLAEALGLPSDDVERIELAALLHDVGKLAVPDEILRKPDKLSPAEWSLVRAHPAIGAEILSTHPQLREIVPLVRAHHERWDGKGYPDGLRGDAIPLGAAIIGLADAFDTMISDRPYRPALRVSEAVEEIRRCRGTQFHPKVVDAFFAALRDPNALPKFLSRQTVYPRSALTAHTLHAIGQQLSAPIDLETLAEVIDLAISGTISNDNIVIFLLDETQDVLRIAYSRHDRDLATRVSLPHGHGLAWRSILTRTPQAVTVPGSPGETVVLWGRRRLFAVLVAPLLDGDHPLGALAVSRVEPRPFTQQEVEILGSLGRNLGPLFRAIRDEHDASSDEQAVETNGTHEGQQDNQDRLVDEIEEETVLP